MLLSFQIELIKLHEDQGIVRAIFTAMVGMLRLILKIKELGCVASEIALKFRLIC